MKKTVAINGITLIALVITIVVLIILATVAINLSLGSNGIFNRAKSAKEKYANAQVYEADEINKASNSIDDYSGATSKDITAEMVGFTPENPAWTGVTNVKEALDYLYNNL